MTYAEMINCVAFIPDETGGVHAVYQARIVAKTTADETPYVRNDPVGLMFWKQRVIYNLAKSTSTVLLLTACGCERYQDGVSEEVSAYKHIEPSVIKHLGKMMVRTFCDTARTDQRTGVRIFREVSTDYEW